VVAKVVKKFKGKYVVVYESYSSGLDIVFDTSKAYAAMKDFETSHGAVMFANRVGGRVFGLYPEYEYSVETHLTYKE